MIYSLNKVNTVSECDALIKLVNQVRKDLVHRKSLIAHSQENAADSTDAVNAEIQVSQLEINAINSILPTLPEGKTKEKYLRRKVSFENRLDVLGFRKSDFGAVSLIEKEWKLARIDKEIEETDALIADLNTRKSQL